MMNMRITNMMMISIQAGCKEEMAECSQVGIVRSSTALIRDKNLSKKILSEGSRLSSERKN